MIEISTAVLGKMCLYAFILGVAFGILYDVIRITRIILGVRYGFAQKSAEFLYSRKYPLIGIYKPGNGQIKKTLLDITVFIGDVIYCIAVGSVFCIFMYYSNDGIFRWQALAFVLLGFFVYYKTFGALIMYFAEIIGIFLKILTKILLYTIAIPFKIMYNIVIGLFGVPVIWCVRCAMRIVTDIKMKRILSASHRGFTDKFLKGRELEDG